MAKTSRLVPLRVIAARLGVSERTVQYDLTNGLAKLRAAMERDGVFAAIPEVR